MKLGLESCSGTMERDFMGLNSKDSVVAVKEEAVEVCKESVFDLIGTDLVRICLVFDLIITD
ncbi:hypothetical protein Hanom_Chr01g00011391 [Helianthus anomalus]